MTIDSRADETSGDLVVFDKVTFNVTEHFENMGEDGCARLLAATPNGTGIRLSISHFNLHAAVSQ